VLFRSPRPPRHGCFGRASTIGKIKHHAVRFHAEATSWQNKVVSEAKKRLAEPEKPAEAKKEEQAAEEKGAESEPTTAPTPGAVETLLAGSETNPFGEPIATEPAATPQPPPPRMEEFKVFGRERFPPHSREIRDTSQLQEGMEVWASAGRMWYLSKVVRVDNQKLARIRFPASAKLPERTLPAAQIRLLAEADGSAARDGGGM